MNFIATHRKTCKTCNQNLLAVTHFGLLPKTLGTESGVTFSDSCFDCTSLMKSPLSGSFLERPPTLQEMSPAFVYGGEVVTLPTKTSAWGFYSRCFKELQAERERKSCRICRKAPSQVKLKRRSKMYLCPRCFNSFPTTLGAYSSLSNYDTTPFYPYEGLFRRIGPYTWPRMEDLFTKIANSFYWVRDGNRVCASSIEEDESYSLKRLTAQFVGEKIKGNIISPRRLISVGHLMYRGKISTFADYKKYTTAVDGSSQRPERIARSRYLIGYLLGDSFPYPEICYQLIQYGVMNKALWGGASSTTDDSQATLAELLAVLLCPRVLSVRVSQMLNLSWSYSLLNRIQKTDEFYIKYKLDSIVSAIESQKDNIMEDAFYVIRKEARWSLLNLRRAKLPKSCYTYAHIAVDLADAMVEEDEWWRLVKIGELVVRAKLLDAYQSSDPPTTCVWDDTVNTMWNSVVSRAGTEEMRHKNFRYTEPVSKKELEPVFIPSPSDSLCSTDWEI